MGAFFFGKNLPSVQTFLIADSVTTGVQSVVILLLINIYLQKAFVLNERLSIYL